MIGKIKNIEVYNERMDKSILDKIWFIGKVDAEVFVDFGCANGNLIKQLSLIYPNLIFMGYDISNDMIDIAKENCNSCTNTWFTSNWNELINKLPNNKKNCLILSSVIHEVYSYGDENSIEKFYSDVFSSELFDFIAIRDMNFDKNDNCDKQLLLNYKNKISNQTKLASQINDFKRIYGDFDNIKNITHFLLKYKYIENWNREVKENYLPIDYNNKNERVYTLSKQYKIIFNEVYTLPFLKMQFKKDFDIDFNHPTHIKLLFAK